MTPPRGRWYAWASLAAALVLSCALTAQDGGPVSYRVSFPAPEHHWMSVEATFPNLPRGPFVARMSRSSPGRYSVHEFAKNIFSIDAFDGAGQPLAVHRADADSWEVSGHDGTVRLVYRIFGDRADGTYLGVDTSHAHINMPAAFLWGVGLDLRPIRVAFAPPPGSDWRVATQLFTTADPFTFTAPNLQYFMDSPTECANFLTTVFSVPDGDTAARFRVVAHADGSPADLSDLAAMLGRLVREERAVFGEFPRYEPGEYTFLLDGMAADVDDGMEHRNSTSISIPGLSLRTREGRAGAFDAIAHEFFHSWNVERIRPAGLEPFDFTRENVTCCLWLAEGFTQYYGELLLRRAGLNDHVPTESVDPVLNGPGRQWRSAVQMSEEAPFWDLAVSNDPTDRARTFIDYYTYGSAIALGLDLSLRELSHGALSLDDYMRRLWQRYGRPADPRPGYVATPYTLADLRAALAELTGNQTFADTVFDRYIEGREAMDYGHLLSLAGFDVRALAPNAGWAGDVSVAEGADGLEIGAAGFRLGAEPVPFDTPAYAAGLDEGDVVTALDGQPATMAAWTALTRRAPGDRVSVAARHQDGSTFTAQLTLRRNPHVDVLPVEAAGSSLTPAQRAFREEWLGTAVK